MIFKDNRTYVFNKRQFLRRFKNNSSYWHEENGKYFWSPKDRVYLGCNTYCTSDEALVFPKEIKISDKDYTLAEVKNFLPAYFYKFYVEV